MGEKMVRSFQVFVVAILLLGCSGSVAGQDGPTLRNFDPIPALNVAKTDLRQAKFPVIDVHTHFAIRLQGDREAPGQIYSRDGCEQHCGIGQL